MTRLANLYYSLFCCAALLTLALPAQAATELNGKYVGMSLAERIDAFVKTCPALFERVETAVAEAGVADPQYYRVPGYPYLRTNRLTAAYAEEVDSVDELAYLLTALRADAAYARNIELLNLGMPRAERRNTLHELRLCGVWLSMRAEQQPQERKKVLEAIARAPTAAAPEAPRTENETVTEQAAPAATTANEFVRWVAAPDAGLADVAHEVLSEYHAQRRDIFGRVGLGASRWQALAAYYAPQWVTATGQAQDRLGRPVLRAGNAAIAHAKPVVHYQVSYARAGDQSLVQIQYFAWFGGNKPESIDGMIWRVTLDAQGEPLVYESLDMEGKEHLWFLAQPLEIAAGANPAVPRPPVTTDTVQVWLQSSSHRVRQVTPTQGATPDNVQTYTLRPYEALFTLEVAGSGTKSLFDAQGRVRGTGGDGDALYHLSRLSLAPQESRYFDDPDLLRRSFVLPAATVKTSGRGKVNGPKTN